MAKLVLSDIEIEEYLSEIISGKKIFSYKGVPMCIKQPSNQDKDGARIIYINKYRELEGIGLPKKDDLKIILLKKGILEKDFYVKKINVEKDIEKLYNIRQKTGSAIQLAKIDSELDYNYNVLTYLDTKESVLMMNSVEYMADMFKINYLISRTTLFGIELEERKWKTYDDFCKETDEELISLCKKKYNESASGLSSKIIRAIARSDEWKKRWEAAKKTNTQVFDGVSSDWDKNRINLCYWSNYYDNIIENLKLSDLSILDDDDAFFEMLRRVANGQQKIGQESFDGEKVDVKTPFQIRY